MKIYVPMDSAAKALGAEEVAAAIRTEAQARGLEVTIIRNGTRGMIWLEPLVEIDSGYGASGPWPCDARRCSGLVERHIGGAGQGSGYRLLCPARHA